MKGLTTTQSTILRFIAEFLDAIHRAPTVAEIQSAFDWTSRTTAYTHLKRLEAKGYLKRDQSKELKRYAINLTDKARSFLNPGQFIAMNANHRYAGDAVIVEQESLTLRDLIPSAEQNDFLYHVQTSRYSREGLAPGTFVLMRPATDLPGEGFALIRTLEKVRFSKYRIEGSVLTVDDRKLAPITYSNSNNTIEVIATVVASLQIHMRI